VAISAQGEVSEIRFTLPLLPPSCNALHQIIWSQRKVELKPTVMLWRNQTKLFIPRFSVTEGALLDIQMTFHYALYHRNGKLKRKDTANLVKVLLDVIAEKCGWDDSIIKSGSWATVDDADEKVVVTLREVCQLSNAAPDG
jgi:Holliday junction resolvase RusA-like endonuclease